MPLTLNLDISQVINLEEKLKSRAEEALRQAAAGLSVMARAHIVEKASKELKSTKDAYIKNVKHKRLNKDTWVVDLVYDPNDSSSKLARMVENGATKFEMIDGLLKSPKAKTAKDGSKFLVVPFQQNKAPSRVPEAGLSLQDTVKQFLKEKGVAWGKIERNPDGTPKTGLLHSHDLNDRPLKTHNGPYQGHGPIGSVRQGPARSGSVTRNGSSIEKLFKIELDKSPRMAGIPFLRGIRVYQSLVKDEAGKPVMGKDGNAKAVRGIFTFRVVSSKMNGSGRWVHPGMKAKKYFPETFDWLVTQWNEKVSKQVIAEILA